MKQAFLKRLYLTFAAMFCIATANAQVSFTAEAPTIVTLDDYFRIEFTVDAQPDNGSFRAPSFEGFDIVAGPSTSTGHSIQYINGRQSSSFSCTYTYLLKPNSTGTHTIAPASVAVDGKVYSTQPLLMEVVKEQNQTSGQSSAGNSNTNDPENSVKEEDVLLLLKLSDTEVYKGEPIHASLVLYTRTEIQDVSNWEMPSFEGFWSQELTTNSYPSRELYNGLVYDTHELKEYIISPQQSGKLQIDPVRLSIVVPVVIQNSRYIDPFMGGREVYYVTREIATPAQTVNVKEFPAGAPKSFAGAVGEFSMQCSMPEQSFAIHTSQAIELTIAGNGNLKFITAPELRLPESFELYEKKVTDNVKTSINGTSGNIVFTYPFVPRAAGEFTIEPIEFTYFDTESNSYKTLATDPMNISVVDDGSGSTHTQKADVDGYGRMKQLNRDIRYIHTDKLAEAAPMTLVLSPGYWLTIVVLIALFIVIYVIMRRRIRQNRNIVARRMKRADKIAVQRLRIAQSYMQQNNRHAFYEELLRAVWGYISDKFNIPVSNLTKETIREEFYRRNISATDAEEFCQVISRADEAQYTPSSDGDMNEIYTDAIDIISRIESAAK